MTGYVDDVFEISMALHAIDPKTSTLLLLMMLMLWLWTARAGGSTKLDRLAGEQQHITSTHELVCTGIV